MIAEHEAEGLGYLFGNIGENCHPSIWEIKNNPILLEAFERGWKDGRADLDRKVRRVAGDNYDI